MGYVDDEDVDAVAAQAADDALVALLAKLDDFHGESRFTTWAYKFAVLEAGRRAHLHEWRRRDMALAAVSWKRLAVPAAGVDGGPEHLELLGALASGIDVLTSHQRCVLVALAIDRVPIDVLAERLNTTRGALYQTLHDARRQLRHTLLERGLVAEPA
jgi:RNA polymerase sigma-70 factor (ECF subfamily)